VEHRAAGRLRARHCGSAPVDGYAAAAVQKFTFRTMGGGLVRSRAAVARRFANARWVLSLAWERAAVIFFHASCAWASVAAGSGTSATRPARSSTSVELESLESLESLDSLGGFESLESLGAAETASASTSAGT